jgi:hypothetical protein
MNASPHNQSLPRIQPVKPFASWRLCVHFPFSWRYSVQLESLALRRQGTEFGVCRNGSVRFTDRCRERILRNAIATCAFEPGRDAFHPVRDFTGKDWDAVERVPTRVKGRIDGKMRDPLNSGQAWVSPRAATKRMAWILAFRVVQGMVSSIWTHRWTLNCISQTGCGSRGDSPDTSILREETIN